MSFPMRSIMTSLAVVAVLVAGMLSAVVYATIENAVEEAPRPQTVAHSDSHVTR